MRREDLTMLSQQDLLQYMKYHLAPWRGMLDSWKKIPDHARPGSYLPDGTGPENLFKGFVKADPATTAILSGAGPATGRP
jgi:hypothetical protein